MNQDLKCQKNILQSQLHIKSQRNARKKYMLEAIRLKLSDNPFQNHRVSQDPGTKNRCNLETRSLSAFENHENREGPKNQAVDFTATFGDYSRNDRNDQRMNESTNGTGENGV